MYEIRHALQSLRRGDHASCPACGDGQVIDLAFARQGSRVRRKITLDCGHVLLGQWSEEEYAFTALPRLQARGV